MENNTGRSVLNGISIIRVDQFKHVTTVSRLGYKKRRKSIKEKRKNSRKEFERVLGEGRNLVTIWRRGGQREKREERDNRDRRKEDDERGNTNQYEKAWDKTSLSILQKRLL